MTEKTRRFRFKPFTFYAEPTPENLKRLSSIRSVYYAYHDSGLLVEDFAPEFQDSVGRILMGPRLEGLELNHIELEHLEKEKKRILSARLSRNQINDLLHSSIKEESKERPHDLVGPLLDYGENEGTKMRLTSKTQKGDAL